MYVQCVWTEARCSPFRGVLVDAGLFPTAARRSTSASPPSCASASPPCAVILVGDRSVVPVAVCPSRGAAVSAVSCLYARPQVRRVVGVGKVRLLGIRGLRDGAPPRVHDLARPGSRVCSRAPTPLGECQESSPYMYVIIRSRERALTVLTGCRPAQAVGHNSEAAHEDEERAQERRHGGTAPRRDREERG